MRNSYTAKANDTVPVVADPLLEGCIGVLYIFVSLAIKFIFKRFRYTIYPGKSTLPNPVKIL